MSVTGECHLLFPPWKVKRPLSNFPLAELSPQLRGSGEGLAALLQLWKRSITVQTPSLYASLVLHEEADVFPSNSYKGESQKRAAAADFRRGVLRTAASNPPVARKYVARTRLTCGRFVTWKHRATLKS